MSSAALDMSLDDVVKQNKTRNSRRVGRGGRRVGKARTKAPVGGIQKGTKATKAATAGADSKAANTTSGDSKIIVSNLPRDVTESMIKDYFSKAVGPILRAMLTFDASGNSRGVATIIFKKAGLANEAQAKLDGVKVDDRAMKIEVVLDPKKPATSKALSERISAGNKNAPKPAASDKPKAATNGKAPRAARGKAGRGGRRGKPTAKTTQELDAEMVDYFEPGAANSSENATNGSAAQPVAEGDANMDEISVGSQEIIT